MTRQRSRSSAAFAFGIVRDLSTSLEMTAFILRCMHGLSQYIALLAIPGVCYNPDRT